MKKPLIYVAGPYTNPDPVMNVQRAIEIAEYVEYMQATPFIPHLSMLWHLVRPNDIETWYARDLEVLDWCHALFRFQGPSTGADREVGHALERGIAVFHEDRNGWAGLRTFIGQWDQALTPMSKWVG